jgi:hypothetical protein
MRNVIVSCIVVAIVVLGGAFAASAQIVPPETPACDRITGGGFIQSTHPNGGKADFGLAAGCRKDSFDDDDDEEERRTPRFGHLEFTDKRVNFKLRSKEITAYLFTENTPDATSLTSKHNEPRGTRDMCGTGRTNNGTEVFWKVQASDNGEPGRGKDFFIIQVRSRDGYDVYTNIGELQGGNIQLHKPPKHSSPNGFGGDCSQFE